MINLDEIKLRLESGDILSNRESKALYESLVFWRERAEAADYVRGEIIDLMCSAFDALSGSLRRMGREP